MLTRPRLVLALALASLPLAAASPLGPFARAQQQPRQTPAREHPPLAGIALARHDLKLSFTISGKVAERLVEPGHHVAAGQPLIQLDDREVVAQIELLTLRAESDLEIQASEAEWLMAQNDEKRIREAFDKNAAAAFEVERVGLEVIRAFLSLELHKQRREEARQQLRQAKLLHSRYILAAPMDGVVEEALASPGESVEAHRPALRLVVTTPLRIEAAAPTSQTVGLRVGQPAWVRFRLPGREKPVEGVIVHLAQVADAASETRLVRIDVPNPDQIPAGFAADVFFIEPAEPPAARRDGEP